MNIINKPLQFLVKNIPVLILYTLCFSSFDGIKEFPDLLIFTFNLQMIIIYFYTLKFPNFLGNGHIFVAGIINDVVIGIPLGTSSLSYLVLSFFSSYIRNATLRPKMRAEWITFIPALLSANLVYFIIINNFSHLTFYYIELLRSTFFTFLFFPFFYYFFYYLQTRVLKDNA
jgi:cell shape-determining protein MreD